MQPRRAPLSRRPRRVARLQDRTRPHGRHFGYGRTRVETPPRERRVSRPSYGALALTMTVFLFLAVVVAGWLSPRSGQLVKSEPVSTARVR